MSFRTLIIEDEEPARLRLTKLLQNHTDKVEIIGSAKNGENGLKKINDLKPDLIFLDIQMPGMNGFEMLSKLQRIPLIIFCTAYDEYALQAFETNSIDYLLKPIKEERLAKAISKLDKFTPHFSRSEILDFLDAIDKKEAKPKVTSLSIKTGKKIIFLKLNDILFFKAKDKYVSVFLKNGEEQLCEQSLQQLVENLPENFRRIHRAILINSDYIKEIHSYFNSRFAFILEDKNRTKLISGRSYQKEIKDWINA
ncbi:LytR/AlgR family response regulator transcription factor [Zunongwangia pacifica]|uniref:LytTR family DNA-binding domain-containing protein n=1 Tax=Zunongwangia pacifica TaxID=2911062 RepID=A0A9X2CQF9_9FLAO|nr:LytTR family DNA-binding domain-containing protein [Zunongwangia pacifica]MCL6219437.1 LytTR family DNA-binding domain-containing protein [Zunongwangia pacifica]